MAEANDKYGRIYQNLVDAGCNQKTIQRCMKLAQENNVEALLSQLYVYRKHLIEQTHNYQEIGTVEMLLACKYITTPVVLLYRFRILIHNFG